MSPDPFSILANPELLGVELIAMATQCRLDDEGLEKGTRIPFKFRKLLKCKKCERPSLTRSGQLLVSCIANRFSGGLPDRFDFSVPNPIFLKKKDHGKGYPHANLSNADKLGLARAGDAQFLSYWRLIGPVPIHDALVHRVFLAHLRQRIDPLFSDSSHAFRADAGRFSVVSAVRCYEKLATTHSHIVKLDIVRFFDEIDHAILGNLCRKMLEQAGFESLESDKLMNVLEKFMACAPRMLSRGAGATAVSQKGVVQGGALSTLLSNIYLHRFDRVMEDNNCRFIRYADDIVIFCQSLEEASDRREVAERFLLADLKLRCGEKVLVSEPFHGVDYLGCKFEDGRKLIRQKTIEKFKKKVKRLTRLGQKTKKGSPCKPTYVIQRINNQLGFITGSNSDSGKRKKCQFRVKYCWARFIAAHDREFDGLEEQFRQIDRLIRYRVRRYWYAFRKRDVPWNNQLIARSNRLFSRLGLRTTMEAYRRARSAMKRRQTECARHDETESKGVPGATHPPWQAT